MPRRPKRSKLTAALNHPSENYDPSDGSDEENSPPEPLHTLPQPSSAGRHTLRTQLIEKDTIIGQLQSIILSLESDLRDLRHSHEDVCCENKVLSRNQFLTATNKSLATRKRKAEQELSAEITKKQKRIKRLEGDRITKQENVDARFSSLQDAFDDRSVEITRLQKDRALATFDIDSRDHTIASLKADLRDKQGSINAIRNRLYASQKQVKRAKASLKLVRMDYKQLRTWNPREHGQYTADARELARNLIYAGCSAGKVEFAVKSCARTFGIQVRGQKFMSRRTVARAVDEGGKYGELQLGREIMDAPGTWPLVFVRITLYT